MAFARIIEVFTAFLKLGLVSFGGPIAHLGYFNDEFVKRRKWLSAEAYADVVALCQFLPGPASSQVGMAIGISRAGVPGALAAWLGFTMPSAIIMVAFAYGMESVSTLANAPWLHGLKIVAVAIVAQAITGMARTLCRGAVHIAIAVIAAALALTVPSTLGQIAGIVLGGVMGWRFIRATDDGEIHPLPLSVSKTTSRAALGVFALLLAGFPLIAAMCDLQAVHLFDSFYRAGALVFGGGHVVLPLLQKEVVPPGWISNEFFLAGYGAAQAVPGPLFTFAAYLGAMMRVPPNGIAGAAIALVAIFLPGFLLVVGALPFWEQLRRQKTAQAMLKGVNAAVVGLLAAALYTPIWTSTIRTVSDFAIALGLFVLLVFWRTPSWLAVVLGAAVASLVAYF